MRPLFPRFSLLLSDFLLDACRIAAPVAIYQLHHPGLAEDFPPLRSLSVLKHNLPGRLSSFVGREAELSEARARLGETRLLTLLGSGGMGKTRLAQEAPGTYNHSLNVASIAETASGSALVPFQTPGTLTSATTPR